MFDTFDKVWVLFKIFLHYNIFIKSTKSFFNYPDIELFRQKVNSLGLTTFDEKLKAIRVLTYPDTLGALEYYLSLIGYLQSYIHFYARLAPPLQELKMIFLYHAPIAGQQQRAYALRQSLGPKHLRNWPLLGWFKTFWISYLPWFTIILESSMDRSWRVQKIWFWSSCLPYILQQGFFWGTLAIYHISAANFFFFRLLTLVKRNNWLIELEIASFV